MNENLSYGLEGEIAGILLKANFNRADNSEHIELIIEDATDSIIKHVNRLAGNPVGKALDSIKLPDSYLIEEWTEFIFRSWRMPYINTPVFEDEYSTSCSFIHYSSMLKDWILADIRCDKLSNYAMITFTKIDMRDMPRDIWRHLIFTQRREMMKHLANGGAWTIDNLTQSIYLSKKLAQMLQLGSTAMIAPLERYLGTIHPEDYDGVITMLDHIDKIMTVFSNRMVLGDDSILYFHSHASPIYDERGNMVRIVGASAFAAQLSHEKQDIAECNRRKEQLYYFSIHDGMTHTYNRAYFWNKMDDLRTKGMVGLCLLLVDVNGLKIINDVYGHNKGDSVLIETAELLKRIFGNLGIISRIGDGEFAVIAPNTDITKIEQLCVLVEDYCEKTGERMLPISVSWGAACCGNKSISIYELFKEAQSSMENNKLINKNSRHSQVVSSLVEALKNRNIETVDHLKRMALMVESIGKKLGLSANESDRLVLLATMHDIGKLSIPDHVINKPGPLNEKEQMIMREHCVMGYRIAMSSKELSHIAHEVLCHHERWDGNGYPLNKSGEQIPFLSQIISLVDSYDVMTHKRVYKEAMSHEEAVEEIKRGMNKQFSPTLTSLFLDTIGSG